MNVFCRILKKQNKHTHTQIQTHTKQGVLGSAFCDVVGVVQKIDQKFGLWIRISKKTVNCLEISSLQLLTKRVVHNFGRDIFFNAEICFNAIC